LFISAAFADCRKHLVRQPTLKPLGTFLAARKDQTVDAQLGNNHQCRAADSTLISSEGAPLVFIEPSKSLAPIRQPERAAHIDTHKPRLASVAHNRSD
jgi:hypothetical protein